MTFTWITSPAGICCTTRLTLALELQSRLWLLGLVTSCTSGGFIHILLVMAVVVLVINLAQGRRAA